MRYKILFIVLCTAVPLAVVEWYARGRFADYADDERYRQMAFDRLLNSLVIPATDRPNSPLFGYALTPHAQRTVETDDYTYRIQTNSVGFRTREIAPPEPNQRRLLLFGDSMFFGVGLDEERTLAGQLEHMSAAAGQPVTVYNYAMMGFSTVQALIAAHTFAPQLQPDHMVLGIFLANDLLPNAISHADSNNHLAYDPERIDHLRNALHARLNPLMSSMALRAWALEAWTPRLRYMFSSEERFLQSTYRLIDDFAALADSLQARASIVIIYPRYAVETSLVRLWSGSRTPGTALVHYARTRGVPTLDLLDYMDGNDDARRYYYTTDGHFNEAGNARVAQAIYDDLIGPHMSEKK